MQPYFFPYAGYFRLFAATDLFVVLDDVQFPRRGWVHRNRLHTATGDTDWLTLPLTKTPQTASILEQRFRPDADELLEERRRRFPVFDDPRADGHELIRRLGPASGSLVEHLVPQLTAVAAGLGFETPVIRSSDLDVDPTVRAADRLIAIALELGADTYLNSPGGRELYDDETFAARGLRLEFLPDHDGPFTSMLERMILENHADLRAEVLASC